MTGEFALWVYLTRTPLLWLTVTLVAYVVAERFSEATGRHPLANPVLHAIWMTGLVLKLTGTPYPTYFQGAQFVHFLLGPATVALAVPLYERRAVVLRALVPMLAALVVGAVTALTSAVLLARAFGLSHGIVVALAPKSVTTGVAMGIVEALGGDPTLTAVLVMLTGVAGAVVVSPLLNLLRVKDLRARGFAAGLAAHGLGTARAFQVSDVAGTFAGIAMGLNAFLTAMLVPLVLGLVK
ncbi:LrgB family protein [Methylobacterium haplocladii]|uniref:Membrane protein n=1 Tax=Methylobacterium haplocladii TaxID=1176176 RepID=A0A512IQ01_9HYPH|nr:LrgB family protein [Methylobacterium haplocladii]GEO99752.1 membrane protein [Methylobacterium haplocladii]GJD84615.1 Inner membrane protein YohK [Methylobacterium haplocladii]GLS60145.1 membrane protein [Methylobacterium haplocladii]